MKAEDIPSGWKLRGVIGFKPKAGGVSTTPEISFSRNGKDLMKALASEDFFFRGGVKESGSAIPSQAPAVAFSGEVEVGKNKTEKILFPSGSGLIGYPLTFVMRVVSTSDGYVTKMEASSKKWIVILNSGSDGFKIRNEGDKSKFRFIVFDMSMGSRA